MLRNRLKQFCSIYLRLRSHCPSLDNVRKEEGGGQKPKVLGNDSFPNQNNCPKVQKTSANLEFGIFLLLRDDISINGQLRSLRKAHVLQPKVKDNVT